MAGITHKFVIVLNKNLEPGVALNAAAHLSLGLSALVDDMEREQMEFTDYQDANGYVYPSISAWPVIILRAREIEIRKFYGEIAEAGLQYTVFLNTMTGGTHEQQMEKTSNTESDALELYGVATFGEKAELDAFTKKLSLWK